MKGLIDRLFLLIIGGALVFFSGISTVSMVISILSLPIQLYKGYVVVAGVIDQSVVGIDDAFRAPGTAAHGVDVALIVDPAVFFGEQSFPVAKHIAADAATRCVAIQRTTLPSQFAGFGLGHKVVRQPAVNVQK